MSETSVGTVRVDIIANASSLEAEISKAKTRLSSFSTESQQLYDKLGGSSKRATANFAKWADSIDKTAESQKLLNAAAAGVPVRVIEEAAQKIRDYRASVESAASAAKELADAQSFDRQHESARQLVKSTEYVNWWKNSLEQADAAEARMSSDRAFLSSLENRSKAAGKTAAEMLEMQAAERGLGTQAAPFIAKLKEQEAGLHRVGKEFNQYGLSAGQQAMALRGVPAQITDIVTSLQGGQRPMTVLLQQGGQLKDMFGGVVPAAKALGGAILGMLNPLTLTAAGVAALGYAFLAGADEATEFQKTLTLTGGAIGVSVDGLQELSKQVGTSTTTTHQAAEVLNQFAKAASVSASSLGDYAKLAIQWSEATGESTQTIVDNFTALAKDPLGALVKLDNQMHFLTASTYDQINALVESGDKTEAARIAQETYANAIADRAPKMAQNLGTVEKAWRAIVNASKQAVDALLAVGRTPTILDKIAEQQGKLKTMQGMQSPFGGPSDAAIAHQKQVIANLYEELRLEDRLSQHRASETKKQIEDTGLAKDRAAFIAGGRSRDQQRSDAIKKENDTWTNLSKGLDQGGTEYENLYNAHLQRIKDIDAKFAQRSTTRAKKAEKPFDPIGDLIKQVEPGFDAYQKYIGKVSGETDRAAAAQQQQWLDQALDVGSITYEQYSEAMDKIASKGEKTTDKLGQFAKQAARNIENSLGDTLYDVLTGKFDDIGSSFGNMIARMAANAAAANLSSALFGNFDKTGSVGGVFGSLLGSVRTGFAELMANNSADPIGSLINYLPSAKGNVFASPDLSRFSGGVYDSPTFFRFAHGAGVFGEAGPEAIMPLKRGADGKLGVQTSSGGAGDVTVNLINNGTPQQVQGKPTVSLDQMGRMVVNVMIDDLQRNGPYARRLKGS